MKEKLYPWLRQLTLRQLRGFDAVVESGSVSAAARSLHLTPPAVSLQLRDLENAIDRLESEAGVEIGGVDSAALRAIGALEPFEKTG